MDKETLIQIQFKAFDCESTKIILKRCQDFIEKNAENKTTPEELKGMVRLLKNIKQIPEEFEILKRNSSK